MKILSTPKGEILIRTAAPDDSASLFKLRLEALTIHPEAFSADVEKTIADGAESWEKRITDYSESQSGVLVVAQARDELVGMTGIVRGYSPKTRHSATAWGVYVNRVYRRLHIAEALMNECFIWSQDQGIVVLKLGVLTINEPAIRCYARCGFSTYGTEPRSIYVNGIYYSEYLMARLL